MNFNRVARTVAPADLPVSVEEVRRHLRIMDNLQDEYLIALVDAATAMIDGPFGIGIVMQPQSYAMRLDSLSGTISIPVYPVRTVEHIEWIDKENGPQTSTAFHLDKISNPARVYLNANGNPIEGSIALHFTAGYDDLPVDLRHAVLMLVGHLFENAEATTATKLEHVPFGVETILNRYRVG